MTDGNLIAFACLISFMILASAYVLIRHSFTLTLITRRADSALKSSSRLRRLRVTQIVDGSPLRSVASLTESNTSTQAFNMTHVPES